MIGSHIHERYMQDELPTRLGGLAADLARIVSFSRNPKSAPVVSSLFEESRFFVEWSVPDLIANDARVEDAEKLVNIQRGLTGSGFGTTHRTTLSRAHNSPSKPSNGRMRYSKCPAC
ncbi:MAG: hypothetical protein HY868_22695 [Chloroflexi bacterium]|nr:hypothetical protein [Chloroflexota bacterium]